ncbi:hypothetical protein VPNG_09202 [Cytospora leucostoma]|uniref:Uncharacterized protein n=1 Tax=Cytospora leucostoma TaxID=1230097 RepID=A0A423VU60_9PEZI|nr:hypothetical protein VPNG_09202 [Cytospora leucostoma]
MERMALRISPLLAYYNNSDLRGAKFKCQVHPGLPDTIERSNHVFVVTKACESGIGSSRYQGYDLLAGNCQLFALSLLSRTVMANGDCSIFVGSKTQLVEWDLSGRHRSPSQAIPRSIDLGFLVRKPRKPRKLTPLSSFTSRLEFNGQSEIRAIRILYEHGPLAPGAADPTGGRGTWAYMWYLTKELGGVTKRQGKRACVEFIEDLKAGNYRDAFYGREALRQELMAQRRQDKQDGMFSLTPRDWFCTKGA